MKKIKQKISFSSPHGHLHEILSVSITIFDSAMTLLGGESDVAVTVPNTGRTACLRNILNCLGLSGEDEGCFA